MFGDSCKRIAGCKKKLFCVHQPAKANKSAIIYLVIFLHDVTKISKVENSSYLQ
jgi:predicted alpha/beta superfamily hydrolase